VAERIATGRLIAVEIDDGSLEPATEEAERELNVAIADLLGDNRFQPSSQPPGRYRLRLGRLDQRLVFAIGDEEGGLASTVTLSLVPFRRLVADYFLVCDSYHAALRTAPPAQIEAIDMGRRAIHDEASALLREQLGGKVAMDAETGRRLFTLLCALHWKG